MQESADVTESSTIGQFKRSGHLVASFSSRKECQAYLKSEKYLWRSNNCRQAYYICRKHLECRNKRVLHPDNTIYEYGEHAENLNVDYLVKKVCRETIKNIPVHMTPLKAVDVCIDAIQESFKSNQSTQMK